MNRVVITGMGIVAPNAVGVPAFCGALREGKSGIAFDGRMRDLKLACQISGRPKLPDGLLESEFPERLRGAMNSAMTYCGVAAIECWRDAGFSYPEPERSDVDWDTGAVIGTGVGGMDTIADRVVPLASAGNTRRLGSTMPEQYMSSAPSAFVGGLFGLGGPVTSVSSACATGTDCIISAWERVRSGTVKRMLAGSTEGDSVYTWAGFDAMRVCCRAFNDEPVRASRPLSATAAGFVPAAGAAVVMLESLDSAVERGARIYAEIVGGAVNCGGQRKGGTITASNPEATRRCVQQALASARVAGADIDYVNGHLTATMADAKEVAALRCGLGLHNGHFPWINSTKAMIGHTLGASGALECVATILQLREGFVHPAINCEDLNPEVQSIASGIPAETIHQDLNMALKVSFGFGDVNACIVVRKYN